jgi:hypothetical protein
VDSVMATAHVPTGSYQIDAQPALKANSPVSVTVTMSWGTVGIPMPTMLGGISPTKQLVATAVMMKE